ncbi:MAG: hypothetical protein FWC75_08155 [Oscillospiraceae bacterium]|nr:hypothetical protein [Oscillospiraceae bacterium]
MADFGKDVRKALEESGCTLVQSCAGDYEIWYSAVTGQHFPVDLVIKSRRHANIVLQHGGVSHQL